MSKDTHRLSQYLPTAEASAEPDNRVKGTVLAQGSDSTLIRTDKGDIVVTDKNGRRR